MAPQTVPNLPIVDFRNENLKPNTTSWTQACSVVRHALEEYGCFVALYDKVSPDLDTEVFASMKELFDLPTEIKSRTNQIKSWNNQDILYGYVTHRPQAPLHESTGIPDSTTVEGVQKFSDLMWPSGNKRFCDTILSYTNSLAELEKTVDRMVFESYGAEKHLEQHVNSTTYLLRPLKYATPQEDSNNGNVGTSVHTDKGFLTILHQNQVNALQVQARNGVWITADFPTDAFVVMAGDAYEIWSNGRIYSPRHKAVMKKGDKTRYCLALFSMNGGITEIPKEVVDQQHPLQFTPVFDNFEMLRFHLAGKADVTGSCAKAYCGITP